MPDVRESDLPKITNYSDIKELRLVKTDGSSVSMTVDNFINAVAEKIARVDGFASVVAELMSLRGIKAYSRNNIGALLYPQEYNIQQAVGIMIAYDSNNNSKYWIGCFSFKLNDHTTLNKIAATIDVVATNNQGTVQFSDSVDRALVIFH